MSNEAIRDIRRLRSDIIIPCAIGLMRCQEKGFRAELAETFRTQERQTFLHDTEKAPKTVTFHGCGLAFDIYENLNGKTSYRKAFFDVATPIFKSLGFTWMNDITGADKPHFQWDGNRKYKNADILNGNMPQKMKGVTMTKTEAKTILKEKAKLSDETIEYISDDFKWGEELAIKLATAIIKGGI